MTPAVDGGAVDRDFIRAAFAGFSVSDGVLRSLAADYAEMNAEREVTKALQGDEFANRPLRFVEGPAFMRDVNGALRRWNATIETLASSQPQLAKLKVKSEGNRQGLDIDDLIATIEGRDEPGCTCRERAKRVVEPFSRDHARAYCSKQYRCLELSQ